MPHTELLIFFLAVACIYASVGFGGGSSYLAILAMYGLPFQEMRLTALVCNIIVVTGGLYIFIRKKELPFKKIIPLVLASVPMAFVGAMMRISEDLFFTILGCCLLVAGILLWIKTAAVSNITPKHKVHYVREMLLGAGIGFLSGMVGIGGGIFLAPILNLLQWDTPKKIAATASFFILINSIAGIAGQVATLPTDINYSRIGLLAIAVLLGGQIGARMGAVKFSQVVVRRVTGLLVFAAGIEVLLKHAHITH